MHGCSHLKCLVPPTFYSPFDITTYENCIMRVAFSNYARNMNNKSNTHTTTLIDVHNKMKHANTGNNNVILSNNNVMLKIPFHYTTRSLYYIHCLYKKKKNTCYNHRNLNKGLLSTLGIIRPHSLAYLISLSIPQSTVFNGVLT